MIKIYFVHFIFYSYYLFYDYKFGTSSDRMFFFNYYFFENKTDDVLNGHKQIKEKHKKF